MTLTAAAGELLQLSQQVLQQQYRSSPAPSVFLQELSDLLFFSSELQHQHRRNSARQARSPIAELPIHGHQ